MCNRHEGLDLPLDPEGDGLVYWADGEIIGFVGLQSGPVVETTGMVHPQHRRQGIGRALLTALRDRAREASAGHCFLVLDDASQSGKAFVAALGGTYHISEHRMELDREVFDGSHEWTEHLELRQAGEDELDLFASLVARAFNDPIEGARGWLEGDMRRPNRRFWIAYRGGEPIGTVRVIGFDGTVYITALGVLPAFRGRGFGRQILSRTAAALDDEGCQQIFIEVETDNANALGLYRSVGFRQVRTYSFYEIPLRVR